MSKVQSLWLLVLIVMVAVALRSVHLESRSIWFDEAFSWRLIQFPFSEMITRDIADVHPPLYYVLLKVWATVFGDSVKALRSFSIAAAAVTVTFVYGFTAYAFSARSAGLLAGLLVAIAGFQIQAAEEARMYTLGTAGAILTAWLLLRVIREEKPVWWWTATYGVATAAFAYIHYYAFFSIAAQAVFAGGYLLVATRGRIGEILHWRLTWRLAAAGLIAALLYAPWVPYFLQQQTQVQAAFWIPALDRWSIPDTAYRMFIPALSLPRSHGGIFVAVSLLPLCLVLLLVLWLALQSFWRGEVMRRAIWLTLMSAVIPITLAALVSLGSRSVYQDRYLVFAHVFFLICLAVVLLQIRPRLLRRVVIGLVLVGMLVAQGRYWQQLAIPSKPGVRAATAALFAERQPGETIVVSSSFIFYSVLHYAEEKFASGTAVKLYSETGDIAHFAGGPVLLPSDLVTADAFSAAGSQVLWAVDTTGFGGAPLPMPAPWQATMSKHFPEVFGYQGEIILTRYQRP